MHGGPGQTLPELEAAVRTALSAVRAALPEGDSDQAVELRMRICHRLAGATEALKLDAMGELLAHSNREHAALETDVVDAWALAEAQVSASLSVPRGTASHLLGTADFLRRKTPRLMGLMLAGRVDMRIARLAESGTLNLAPELFPVVDEAIAAQAEKWGAWTRKRISDALDAIIVRVDRDGIRQRREHEKQQFRIWINHSQAQTGTTEIHATVDGDTGVAFDQLLDVMARSVCGEDPRNLEDRKLAAFTALVRGDETLGCQCGQPSCAKAKNKPSSNVMVHVVMNSSTLAGEDDLPAYLHGLGVITAEQAREWTCSARLRSLNPNHYRIPRWLSDDVRLRDVTCRAPGCESPAWKGDLDHTVPFGPKTRGKTESENLKSLCRRHHLVKTFHDWHDHQEPDGTVIWTDPLGNRHVTTPESHDLFPALTAPRRSRTRAENRRRERERERALNRRDRALATANASPPESGEPPPF